jgi:hypothetical protein
MDSNTHSSEHSTGPIDRLSGGLAALAAAVDGLAAEDLAGLPEGVRAERVLALRRLADRLEGLWLGELADLDARGAAGAEDGAPAPPPPAGCATASGLGAGAAHSCVWTARALFRGPLPRTAQALTSGELSAAHAAVLAHRHPGAPHPHHRQGRTSPGGGGPAPGPPSAAAGRGPPAPGGCSRGG